MKNKGLGIWMLIALVAGNMIGSGVFMLPASLAEYGTIGIVAWGLTAIGAMFLALMFAQFSRMIPITGGPYAYTRAGLGKFVGFMVAYNYWVGLWTGNAAIAVAFVGYFAVFFPVVAKSPMLSFLVSAGLVWFLTLINAVGVRQAGFVQVVTTILKLIPIILIALVGVFHIRPELLTTHFNVTGHSNISVLASAATLTFWSFVGVESATIPADDVVNPEVMIPRATIIGTLLATVVYIFSAIAVMGSIPIPELVTSTAPFADCAAITFGPWGRLLVAGGAAIACLGTLNGWLMMQGQIPMAAARDKLFPKVFMSTNAAGAPVFGLVLSSVLITFLLYMSNNASLVKQFTLIILLATLTQVIPYFLTSISQIVLFLKDKRYAEKGPIGRHIFIAVVSTLYTLCLIIGTEWKILILGAFLLLSSIPLYGLLKWREKKAKRA